MTDQCARDLMERLIAELFESHQSAIESKLAELVLNGGTAVERISLDQRFDRTTILVEQVPLAEFLVGPADEVTRCDV